MREITNLMDHYRLIARLIWNTGFWPNPDLRNWDSRERFEQIKRLLFESLVAAQLRDKGCCRNIDTEADWVYRVIPLGPGSVPIMIQRPREGDRNHYWDDPVKEVSASDAELHFLDYFDWNEMEYADFQYYRVHITSFASQPHLVGREALLDHYHARIFIASRAGTDFQKSAHEQSESE